jgi:quercetin dioxygenase-like cupin family protein
MTIPSLARTRASLGLAALALGAGALSGCAAQQLHASPETVSSAGAAAAAADAQSGTCPDTAPATLSSNVAGTVASARSILEPPSRKTEGSGMEMFVFDRKEFRIPYHASVDAFATLIAHGDHTGKTRVSCLSVEPGGVIGEHPATGGQLFLVVAGSGWVSAADGRRLEIRAGQGVRWDPEEVHTSGSDSGMTAIAVEGPSLEIFSPE